MLGMPSPPMQQEKLFICMAVINNLSDDLQILHNLDGWSGFSVLRVVWGGGGHGSSCKKA